MSLAESFHRFGYARLDTPAYFRDEIELLIQQEKWIRSETYTRLPSWHTHAGMISRESQLTELELCESLLKKVPDAYLSSVKKLISDSDCFQDMLYLHDFSISYFNMWDGTENLDWHCDQISKGDAFLLAYFTEQYEWQNQWGGHVEFGRRRLDGDWLSKPGLVTGISKINPVHGTVLLCNNNNPQFVHRVIPLEDENIRRVTILVGLNMNKKIYS